MDHFGLKSLVRRALGAMGYKITRLMQSPGETLVGLRALPIHTVVDVGANLGQFARVVSTIYPRATIYSFEPQPSVYRRLASWAETTDGKVIPLQVALGDQEGTLDFIVHVEHDPSSSFLESTRVLEAAYPATLAHASARVAVTTLDSLVRAGRVKLEADTLVKLDVQGYEDRVIAGARATLLKARAVITEVNLDELYKGQATFEGIVRSLADLGLHYAGNLDQVAGTDGHIVYVDAVFKR